MNIKQSLTTTLITSTLVLSTLTPSFAAANITVSGNGFGSQNWVEHMQQKISSLFQDIRSNTQNTIRLNTTTGGNATALTTRGNNQTQSGNAQSSVGISNNGDSNTATTHNGQMSGENNRGGNGMGNEKMSGMDTMGRTRTQNQGFTDGWFNGKTVKFFYHKFDFFCKNPPSSGASSTCEAGADAVTAPPQQGTIPELYVMTPLGFTPPVSTLQCPTVGNCINHPATIDVSRVLGAGTENLSLPAHSHIIDETTPGWWKIVVIGVKDQGVWDKIVAGKSIDTVRQLQADSANANKITGDIPSNSFLFFDVLNK